MQLSQQLRTDLITDKAKQKSAPSKWIEKKSQQFVYDESSALEWFQSKGSESNFANIRIFTYTNNKAEEWNRKIRKQLGYVTDGEIEPITINEPLINLVNKPYCGVFNGDSFIVDKIHESVELSSTYNCDHEFCKRVKNRRSEFSLHKADISIYTENNQVQKKEIYVTSRTIPPNDPVVNVFLTLTYGVILLTEMKNLKRADLTQKKIMQIGIKLEILSYCSSIILAMHVQQPHKTQADSFDFGVIDISDEMKDPEMAYTTLQIKRFYSVQERLVFDNSSSTKPR